MHAAFLLILLASIFMPPKPDRYVTDRAFVLKDPNALNAKLANFERQTSDQILVYIDQRLPPHTTIEEMGSEAMRKWGVGQKGKDNGAILFVFVGDRKMRIEVGYGLEGSLTDAKSKRITSTVIKPAFQRGDFNGGIEEGVNAILATVRGEPYRRTGKTVAQQNPTREALGAFLFGCFLPIVIADTAVYIFEVTVKNQGTAASPSSASLGNKALVQAMAQDKAGWGNGVFLNALPPGMSQVVDIPVYYLMSDPAFMVNNAPHPFMAIADPLGLVAESDESNNKKGPINMGAPANCPRPQPNP